MITRAVSFIFCFLIFSIATVGQTAQLKGKVLDAINNEPVPFANVVIDGTAIGTTTNDNGDFFLENLSPGYLRLKVSFIGFETKLSSEIEIRTSRKNHVTIRMERSTQQLEEVQITAQPINRKVESPLSMRTINLAEIEKSPGANRDISAVIQSFPGVLSTPANRNDLLIRGGGPSENRFFLDGVEVPFINHFATQGASGGSVGIINADFLREVNFYSGAFPANRGNALSSVFNFSQIDGSSDEYTFQTTVGASEVAATVDGPIGDNTTFIFSARRSYLQLLFKALKLPFLPTFNDAQFKIKTRIDTKNELTFIGLGAYDHSKLNLNIDDPDDSQQAIISSLPDYNQWSYTLGAVYKHYRQNGYSTIVLSRSDFNNGAEKYFENDDSSEENKILDYTSREAENKLRLENTSIVDGYKLNVGSSIDLLNYTNETNQKRYFDDELLNVNYNTDFNLLKWALFFQISKKYFRDQLALSVGLRSDANNYANSMNNFLKQFSPRGSLSYALSEKWNANFNIGRYYQLPPNTSLGFKLNNKLVNKDNNIKYIQADHIVGGVDYRPKQYLFLSLEAFQKTYDRYPVSIKNQLSLANIGVDYDVVGNEEVVSTGKGLVYGAELQARINRKQDFNLNLSYTYVRSKFKNDKNSDYVPSSWDAKHLIKITTTKKLGKSWNIGARWLYTGGLPFTPYDVEKSSLVKAWNLTGGPYLDYSQSNTKRFDAFHQLDVRVDKYFYLDRLTAKIYIDIQNLYNFKSQQRDILVRKTDANGNFLLTDNGKRYQFKRVTKESGTVLPTIGLMIEF